MYHGDERLMKMLSETTGLEKLKEIREGFRSAVGVFERNAAPCATCKTPGACCLDEHFVNVRITRLEAVAIRDTIDELQDAKREEIVRKVNAAIERNDLKNDPNGTYACPLYDRRIGCLVHETAKPLPCIHHACYERKKDLPPDEILELAEIDVERLNFKVYGRWPLTQSLPVAIQKVSS